MNLPLKASTKCSTKKTLNKSKSHVNIKLPTSNPTASFNSSPSSTSSSSSYSYINNYNFNNVKNFEQEAKDNNNIQNQQANNTDKAGYSIQNILNFAAQQYVAVNTNQTYTNSIKRSKQQNYTHWSTSNENINNSDENSFIKDPRRIIENNSNLSKYYN